MIIAYMDSSNVQEAFRARKAMGKFQLNLVITVLFIHASLISTEAPFMQ